MRFWRQGLRNRISERRKIAGLYPFVNAIEPPLPDFFDRFLSRSLADTVQRGVNYGLEYSRLL
jgi:hypothetical protein